MKTTILAAGIMAWMSLVSVFAALPNADNPVIECGLEEYEFCIEDASVGLTISSTNSQLINCVGAVIKASAYVTNIPGELEIGLINEDCTYDVTNVLVDAVLVTNWWVASVGAYSASGGGLDASFSPTNCGAGTITFKQAFSNSPPCTLTGLVSASVGFQVIKVALTPASVTARVMRCHDTNYNPTAGFCLTSDSCAPSGVTWSISPAGAPISGGGNCATVSLGTTGTNYTITATSIDKPDCTATATLTVIIEELSMNLAKTNVFVNSDDDNANGTNDVGEALTGVGTTVTNENDLVLLSLQASGFATNEIITLTAYLTNAASGHIRVWPDNTRGPGALLIDTTNVAMRSVQWPAGSVPTNLWVEGLQHSFTNHDVQLVLSPASGCPLTNSLTVFDVTSVVWEAMLSPLTNNVNLGGVGGGLALFPDKPTATSTGDFSALRVLATVAPVRDGLSVYLKSFDVDDPSSTNAPPLDDETMVQDNKATNNLAGIFAVTGTNTVTGLTSTNGITTNVFNVTMQPGDNFRVTASLLGDFQNHCAARQTNDHGALVFGSTTNEIPSNYQTDMLTVWRRLHVEVDSMAAVTNNFVTGNIIGIGGSPTAATNLTLLGSTTLTTALTPPDNSPNLSASTSLGRFENGTIIIGTGSGQTTNAVTGNGNNFVRAVGGFNIPFALTNAGGSNVVTGQILALIVSGPNWFYGLDANLGTNLYNGGTLTVAGHTFTVLTNGATSVKVPIASLLNFHLHDDDDDSRLPYANPSLASLTVALRDAYVCVINDGGGEITNNKQSVPFVLNVENTTTLYNTVPGSVGAFESKPNRADDFWLVWLCSAYQTFTTPGAGYLVSPDLRADGDANSENPLIAITTLPDNTLPSGGALLFLENLHDQGTNYYSTVASILEPQVVAHELGHAFGLLDHVPTDPVNWNSMMGAFWVPGTPFAPVDIDAIRRRTKSPGVP